MDAEGNARERGGDARGVGKRLEEISADRPEDVERPFEAASSDSTAFMPRAPGIGKPQRLSRRARFFSSRPPPGRTFGAQPTSDPPCTPEWPRIGTRPHFSRPTHPRARARFATARTVSEPWACCVSPIDQTKIPVFAEARRSAKRRISSGEDTREAREVVHVLPVERSLPFREACGAAADERFVDVPLFEEKLPDAVQEREISTRVDREPVVGELRAEKGAFGVGRNPVGLEARLAVWIHDGHARPELLRLAEVLRRDRLVVRGVRPEEDDEVRAEPVGVGARGSAPADGALQRDRGRGMAEARGVVHVVRAEKPRDLSGDVVRLVRQAAGGDVERNARRIRRLKPPGRSSNRLLPGNAGEALLSRAAAHRVRNTAQPSHRLRRKSGKPRDIGENRRIESAPRVRTKQVQPHHAQVDAVDREVADARRAERAAVAHAARQDAPRVRELAAVLPGDARHLAIVLRLRPAEARGRKARPVLRAPAHRARVRSRKVP